MINILLYILLVVVGLFFCKYLYWFINNIINKPILQNIYSEFIQSDEIIDNFIIKNKNNSFSVVIKINGYPYHAEENLDKINAENLMLRSKLLNISHNNMDDAINIKFIFSKFNINSEIKILSIMEITSNNINELKDISQNMISQLKSYNAEILKNKDLIEYLFLNANKTSKDFISNFSSDINLLNSFSNLEFKNDFGIIENIDKKRIFKILTFNFGSEINSNYYNDIIGGGFEYDFVIHSRFLNKFNTTNLIRIDEKNISASNDDENKKVKSSVNTSKKKETELGEATERFLNEEDSIAMFDVFIIIYADDEKKLENSINSFKEIISKYQINLVVEKQLTSFFFMQALVGWYFSYKLNFFVPYGNYMVYAKKILSSTLAGLVDFIELPKGLTKTDWGNKAITILNTHYNNNYNLNFHVDERPVAVAHGVVIASTGGGKTTAIQYLEKCILENYPEVDIYAFDRLNGMKIFTAWQNGNNVDFTSLALNPLQIDLTLEEAKESFKDITDELLLKDYIEDNKNFLNNFFFMLANPDNSEENQILTNFLNVLPLLPKNQRIFKSLFKEILANSSLKDKLTIWAEGKYSNYINAEEDKLDLSNKLNTFQMDKILDDKILSAPILYYIMAKIRQKARFTGKPHFVFIDETAKMIQNKHLQKEIEALLQEHRKLRGAVWLAFQNATSFLDDNQLRSLILNQCQNILLFYSEAINNDILDNLKIHESVYKNLENVRKKHKNSYFVLLKRPNENVILDFNLANKLGENIKFLSSSTKDVLKYEELFKQYGNEWKNFF